LKIAADLLRGAMSSSEPSEPVQEAPPPSDIAGVIGLLNRHRTEIDKNLVTVVEMLNANYGMTAALVIVAILVIASYWRG
jgi:hypothetical protein